MAVEVYNVVCPSCGYKEEGLLVTGIEENAAEVSRIAVCATCRKVLSVRVPPRRKRMLELRRQVKNTIERMTLMQERFLENLERRKNELGPKVRSGTATPEERARFARAVEGTSFSKDSEIEHLRRTLTLVEKALESASDEPVVHSSCGRTLDLPEEGLSGYSIACPSCGADLVVRLVGRERGEHLLER